MQRSRSSVLACAFLAVATTAPAARARDAAEDLQPFASFGRAASRPALSLACVDFTGLPTEALDELLTETAALVALLGVDASIRTSAPGAPLDPGAVTLILLNGSAPAHLKRGVMGVVQRQGASRVLWVYSAGVAAGSRVPWEARARWQPRERSSFATAMARVAVHEMVHLVCPWRGHDADGLMAQTLSASRLTGSRIPVSLELRRDFIAGVDAWSGRSFIVARGEPPFAH